MEFSFPPVPRGYSDVLVARGLLVAWTIVGAGILIMRLRHWKFIRPRETFFWSAAGCISWVVAGVGKCPYWGFDNNRWLLPIEAAASFVCLVGITIGLSKNYREGSPAARYFSSGICVVGVLFLGVVLQPSLGHPREFSFRSQCRNNLKSIALAMYNYSDFRGEFPPPISGDEPVSWRVSILPYLDQKPLFDQYDQQKSWDHAVNDKVARQKVDFLICLSNYQSQQDSQTRWYTAYSMPTGPHTVGDKPTGTTIRDITDGSSHTFLVVEACGAQIVWTEPRDVNVASQPTGINLNGTKPGNSAGWLSSYHYQATHVAMADGTVRLLFTNTDPALLKKLATIDGGEVMDKEKF